jgi:hypothetical protein
MNCFDPNNSVMDFGDRGRIPVTVESVVKVLGVPMGTSVFPCMQDIDATNMIMQMFGITDGVQPTISTVDKELGPGYPADDDYLRKFVIYMTHSLFAPTTGIKISPKCYPPVMNTEAIRRYNWAKFILDTIVQTANAKGSKNWFKACMSFLMVSLTTCMNSFFLLKCENTCTSCSS